MLPFHGCHRLQCGWWSRLRGVSLPRVRALDAEGRLPFINDILQFYPTLSESIAERMAVTFPSHEAGDCLTSEGNAFDVRFLSNVPAHSDTTVCANEMYYLTGRNHTTVRCTLTTSEYEEACRALEARSS